MKLQQFDGGSATRLRPQFLQVNEAVEYSNIDSYKGTLVPVKSKVLQADVLQQYHHYYIAQSQWVSKAIKTDFLEFNKKLYSTDRASTQEVFDGTNTYQIGIDTPPVLSTFVKNEHPEPVIDITVDANLNTAGIPRVNTYYVLVNRDATTISTILALKVDPSGRIVTIATKATSVESPVIVSLATTSTMKPEFTKPVGITLGTVGVGVYRLYQGTYRLVANITTSGGGIQDSVEDISANAALDVTQLGEVQGIVRYAMTYYNSANGIESAPSLVSGEVNMRKGGTVDINSLPVSSDAQVDQKRIYRVGHDITVLTRVDTIANSLTTYTDNIADIDVEGSLQETSGDNPAPANLAFLTEAYAILFGAVGNKLVYTKTGEPWNWPALNFITYESDITGLATTANGILVFTKFRTHLVTGTGPASFATQLLSGDQGCIAFESVINISNAALWVSTDGVCTSDGSRVVVISKGKLDKLALTPVSSVVYDEVYYVVNADDSILAFDFGLGKMFKTFDLGVSTVHVANDKLYGWKLGEFFELFASTDNESMRYLSPRFIEGKATEMKTYKKVYIYSKGDIIIDIIIDDVVVVTDTFSEENSYTIQVPQDKQRGFFIQFDIRGTGEVYELEYVAGPRTND